MIQEEMKPWHDELELRCSVLSPLWFALARQPRWRRRICALAGRGEGGPMFSATMRRILREYCAVHVGAYSYGPCLVPGAFPGGVTIGRYVSIADSVQIFRRNHPTERVSMHPFFYNSAQGLIAQDNIESVPLEIGHDAWIAARAIILPGCQRIGIGAVVAAGAVVSGDVPDFAIVGGNPARTIRMRFAPEICAQLLDSQWWMQPLSRLRTELDLLTQPLNPTAQQHPLLQPAGHHAHHHALYTRPRRLRKDGRTVGDRATHD